MGNNTSIQQQNLQYHGGNGNNGHISNNKNVRKSTASSSVNKESPTSNAQIRKSTATSKHNHQSLDDEFSDLILHQVINKGNNNSNNNNNNNNEKKDQFSNDLIEDEFNELNEKLVETESTSLSRNIIPENNNKRMHDEDYDDNYMDIDEDYPNESNIFPDEFETERSNQTPTPDLTKVDFTKITNNNNNIKNDYFNQKTPAPAQTQSAASIARAASHTPSPRIIEHNQNQNQNQTQAQNISIPPPTKKRNTGSMLIPIEIKWVNTNKEFISKISIIGSFSNWRDVIKLNPSMQHPNEYTTTLILPLGVHKLLYIINNEYRVSDQLPTATDQEGLFFNWFEVIDDTHLFNHSSNQSTHIGASSEYDANIIPSDSISSFYYPRQAGKYETDKIQEKSMDLLHKISKENSSQFEHVEYYENNSNTTNSQPETPLEEPEQESPLLHPQTSQLNSSSYQYSNEIPEMFINYDYFKFKPQDYELPEPPQLPPHLNNVLLNKISSSSNSNSNISSNSNLIPSNFNNNTVTGTTQTYSHKRPPLRRADSSYYASNKEAYHLSIPNHVILNHLMTTSIKNDVLTVACITRYSGKFVTQIMHSPADTNNK
ncbi:unnamed protein product [Candida verbasci]|uniref:Association with the SNF1 complex (ASC) domain-containing protein n=1 Tax=Candida verbasci TaxID=1227364 RepID=A0A9W4TUA7_9ASCO|nr:unnamed protein product [Candida verbasci]